MAFVEKDSKLYQILLDKAKNGDTVAEIEGGRQKHDVNNVSYILAHKGVHYRTNLSASYDDGILEFDAAYDDPQFYKVVKQVVVTHNWVAV